MNKEYILKDGKALIIDDTYNDETIKYYDNLDEVLIKENLIETIEEKLRKLKEEIKNYSEFFKLRKKERLYMLLLFIFGAPIIFTILNCFNLETAGTLLNAIKNSLIVGLIFAPGMTAFGLLLNLISICQDNIAKKECSGKEAQVKFLTKELIKQEEEVEELKKDLSSTSNTTYLKRIKVNDIEALKELREKVLQYYHIGYNKKKFNKYYQNGELDEIVDKEDYELVKEIIGETGPVLAKRKN